MIEDSDAMQNLVVMAVRTGGRRRSVHTLKRSKGWQTVDVGAKAKGHYTLRQRVENIFSVGVVCFQMKEYEKRAAVKKGMECVVV